MKKIYQIPTTDIANIELQQMIAASEEVTLSNNDYDGEAKIESRRSDFSVWDDEEEE